MISLLKSHYGNKCTGIKINYKGNFVNPILKEMHFCKAVTYSFDNTLLVNKDNLLCMGSRYCFGLEKNVNELIKHISFESNISSKIIEKLVEDIPVLKTKNISILLGIQESMENDIKPDLYILHLNPKDTMNMIRLYTAKTGKIPIIKPIAFMSVCGNILAQTYKSNKMSISFGCPESRKHGGVYSNYVIVGLPYTDCKMIFNEYKN